MAFISTKMLRLFCSSVLLSTVFSLNLSALAQPVPKLRQEMTYSETRNLLIQEGWQAVFNATQVNNPDRGAVIDNLIEKGYTEVVDCAGAGLGLCVFQQERVFETCQTTWQTGIGAVVGLMGGKAADLLHKEEEEEDKNKQ
jgi:hypothetical protein